MKGTEKIVARIEDEAKAKAQAILDEAAAKAKETESSYNQAAQDEYWNMVRAGVKECEDLSERQKRVAQMEGKKEILAVKQEMISEAFDKAKEKLASMEKKNYADFLVKLAVNAAAAGNGEIVLNARDREAVGAEVAQRANAALADKATVSLSDEVRETAGGLVFRTGGVEVNSTVESLIDFLRSDMSSELARIMFE